MNNKNAQKSMWISYFLLAVAIICFYQILINLNSIVDVLGQFYGMLSPFLTGFIIAYILNIPYEFFRSRLSKSTSSFLRKNRKLLSILITYFLLFLVVFLAISIIVPSVYNSLMHFARNLTVYYRNLIEIVETLNISEIINFEFNLEALFQSVVFNPAIIENISSSSISAVLGVSTFFISGFLSFISSIYMLMEKERFQVFLTKTMKVIFSIPAYKVVSTYLSNINHYFKQYIFCQSIDALILGTIVTIEMSIIGAQYALVLGLMLGVMNYVPIFGSIVGTIIAIIIIAITDSISKALIATVVLLITQQIDANFISPKLLGASFSISPLLVIISITIGGAIAGVFGMIVAIPIIAVLKNLLNDILSILEKKKLQKELSKTNLTD